MAEERQSVALSQLTAHRHRRNRSTGCTTDLLCGCGKQQDRRPAGNAVCFLSSGHIDDSSTKILPGWPPRHSSRMKLERAVVQASPEKCRSWRCEPLLFLGKSDQELPGLISCRGNASALIEFSKEDSEENGEDGDVQPSTGRTEAVSVFSSSGKGCASSAAAPAFCLDMVPSSSVGWAEWSTFRLANSAGDSGDEDSLFGEAEEEVSMRHYNRR